MYNMKIVVLPLEKISLPKESMRTYHDPTGIEELAYSMASVGLIHPISVKWTGERYEIVAGERRFMAAQKLLWQELPCYIIQKNQLSGDVIKIIENVQRKETTPIEEFRMLVRLLEDYHMSQKELAKILGKSEAWVSQRLTIQNWPEYLQEALEAEYLPFHICREIANIKDKEIQRDIFDLAKQLPEATMAEIKSWKSAYEAAEGSPSKKKKQEGEDKEVNAVELAGKRKNICTCCKRLAGETILTYIPVCQTCYVELINAIEDTKKEALRNEEPSTLPPHP